MGIGSGAGPPCANSGASANPKLDPWSVKPEAEADGDTSEIGLFAAETAVGPPESTAVLALSCPEAPSATETGGVLETGSRVDPTGVPVVATDPGCDGAGDGDGEGSDRAGRMIPGMVTETGESAIDGVPRTLIGARSIEGRVIGGTSTEGRAIGGRPSCCERGATAVFTTGATAATAVFTTGATAATAVFTTGATAATAVFTTGATAATVPEIGVATAPTTPATELVDLPTAAVEPATTSVAEVTTGAAAPTTDETAETA